MEWAPRRNAQLVNNLNQFQNFTKMHIVEMVITTVASNAMQSLSHGQPNKKWANENQDKVQEMMHEWRQKNPVYGSKWRKNNLDKISNYAQIRRARMVGNGGNLTIEEWCAILDFYGHRCLRCERSDVKLTIDHVLPIFLGGTHTIDNVQPLCDPCNSSKKDKHIDYRKELYHETPRD